MRVNRLVQWNKESLDFLKSAPDNSIDLRVMACHACASQTGEAFEEFVNSVNSENIRRKIRKVIILDSSYLYRHCVPGFYQYADPNIRTMWLLNNLYSIEKLEADVVMESWVEQVNSEEFKRAYKQIMIDFSGDENGNGIIPKFREIIISHSGKASSKGKGSLEGCINFTIEECAHACVYLKNEIIAYPLDFGPSIAFVNKHYKLNIRHLRYKISNHAETYKYSIPDPDKINQKVISFLTEAASNVNFFVSDKTGNFIYKNLAFAKIAGNIRAPDLDPNAWEISKKVMQERKQIIVEEGNLGVRYLSVKSPLIVDGEVEGVIGVAIDLTDSKKAEELESQNKIQKMRIEEQEKFKIISEQVAHDICSPLVVLSMLSKHCKNLSEKEHIALRNSITTIESIAKNLLDGYKRENNVLTEESYVLFPFSISEILGDKKHQF
ncbi:hypothetical protein FACS189449_11040 [Alphaproteobacteria bacterium]|nr:hypothetical protein FACS189449_11040 [Alphaproteobacteria bacterium]